MTPAAKPREIGMLFGPDMVRATLEGRKRVTRRFQFSGRPGDIIWVRETWTESPDGPIYRATASEAGSLEPGDSIRWTPSIHMPRRVARLFLRVIDVREERLQDITEEDALREGVAIDIGHAYQVAGNPSWVHKTARGCFETLWGSLYGHKPGKAWADNPEVKRVEFEVMK